jgi:hypothetical protein
MAAMGMVMQLAGHLPIRRNASISPANRSPVGRWCCAQPGPSARLTLRNSSRDASHICSAAAVDVDALEAQVQGVLEVSSHPQEQEVGVES